MPPEDDTPNAHDRRLYFLLNVGQRRVQRWIDTRSAEHAGVSAAQAGVLFYLMRHEHALVGEVGAALQLSPSSMTGLANRMMSAGLLERRADENDGRATRLSITAAGQAVIGQARVVLGDLNDKLHDGFSEEELAVVARWLRHLQDKFPPDF